MKVSIIQFMIAILPLTLLIMLSGCNCNDETYFRIIGIDSDVRNENTIYNEKTFEEILYENYTINIYYQPQYYSKNIFPNLNLINSAYATQPCPGDGFAGCNELISKINVYVHADYDSIHLVNDTVTSLFNIRIDNAYGIFDTNIVNLVDFKDYKLESNFNYYLTLMLNEPPTIDSIQWFTIEMVMSNDEKFETETIKAIIN